MVEKMKLYSAVELRTVDQYVVYNVLTELFYPPFRDGGPIGGVKDISEAVMYSSYKAAEKQATRMNPSCYLEWTLTGNKKKPWPFVSLKNQEEKVPYREVECSGPWVVARAKLVVHLPMFSESDFKL
jgi:hypothetical protein